MVAPIRVQIVGDMAGLEKALAGSAKHVEAFGGTLSADLPGWAGVAVDATKRVGQAVFNSGKAAKDAAAEEAAFADAMGNLGVTSDEQVAAMNGAIDAAQRLAFEDTESRNAMKSLQTATGDTNESLDLFAAAQDIARYSGESLESASDALAKAYVGQDGALKRMIPGLESGATAQDTIGEASKIAAGQADHYGKSSEAAAKKAKIAFGELKEKVGGELGPALKDLWDSLQPIIVDLIRLAQKVLPPVIKAISVFAKGFSKVVDAIGRVIDAIQKLMGWLKDLLAPIQNVIDKLGKIDLNPFNRGQEIVAGQGAGSLSATTRATGTPAATGAKTGAGVTVNIYGDPSVIEARVTAALRAYARRNGVGAVFAPDRN